MRRLVVLLAVALVGAGLAGRFVSADATRVNQSSISSVTLRAELQVIHDHPQFACYLTALYGMNTSSSSVAFNATGTASWTQMQVEGLAITDWVSRHDHWKPSNVNVPQATTEFINELTNSAQANAATCTTSAASAVAALPKWFVKNMVVNEAASVWLLKHTPGTVPLTTAGLESYYNSHKDFYDTICISVAVVSYSNLRAFQTDMAAGMSVSNLAKKYSEDPSGSKGGGYGCYGPSSQSYSVVRKDTYGTPMNTFSTSFTAVNYAGSTAALYVAPTKRTPNTFADAETVVLSDVRSYNASLASDEQKALLSLAGVYVNPSLGRWSTSSLKVNALSTPSPNVTPGGGASLGF